MGVCAFVCALVEMAVAEIARVKEIEITNLRPEGANSRQMVVFIEGENNKKEAIAEFLSVSAACFLARGEVLV
jgi:hypothetical protein